MTDNDIKKALECCCKGANQDCFECPLQNSWNCYQILRENALDLVNRQQAEIERYLHSIKLLEKDVAGAKAEGIKALAHLLIDKAGAEGGLFVFAISPTMQ